jgi:hypothetical protein
VYDFKIILPFQINDRNEKKCNFCNTATVFYAMYATERKIWRQFHQPYGTKVKCTRRLRSASPTKIHPTLLVCIARKYDLQQAWATSGPRATSGQRSSSMWLSSYNFIILYSYFNIENMLKIQKNF